MTQTDLLLHDLAGQLNDELSLEHHLHLCEWFSDRADHLPDLVRDALDVHAMALEQAEATRAALYRSIRAADQQHLAA